MTELNSQLLPGCQGNQLRITKQKEALPSQWQWEAPPASASSQNPTMTFTEHVPKLSTPLTPVGKLEASMLDKQTISQHVSQETGSGIPWPCQPSDSNNQISRWEAQSWVWACCDEILKHHFYYYYYYWKINHLQTYSFLSTLTVIVSLVKSRKRNGGKSWHQLCMIKQFHSSLTVLKAKNFQLQLLVTARNALIFQEILKKNP